jgi:hypothetical protein
MRLRRKPRLTLEQVMSSRPVRNDQIRSESTEDGGLRLFVERRGDWWVRLLSLIFPIPRERIVELDTVGEEIWKLCDGEHTLKELIFIFEERHKLTRGEAEWSLRTYLRDLGKRGLVAFAMDEAHTSEKKLEGEQSHGKCA